MKEVVKNRLHELLKLKRFPVPSQNPAEPPQDVIVAVSDLSDAKDGGGETYANKDALKKDNLFTWDNFKKMWVTSPENFKAAQERIAFINNNNRFNKMDATTKKYGPHPENLNRQQQEFIDKLENLEQVIVQSDAITDGGQIESKLALYVQDLANATDEKAADAAIRRYLTFQSKFHSYSFTNTILIMIQRPNSTQVAGRTDWKTKFNRYVVAGAQPIWIFAPLIIGKGKKNDIGDEGLDKEVNSGRLVGFKAVQVFDLADTRPFGNEEPVTTPQWYSEENPTETTEKLYGYLSQVIKNLGIDLTHNGSRNGERGYSAGGHINMSSEIKGAGELSTLVHELAHELMHRPTSKFYQGPEVKSSKAIKELQAESVAYVVMKHYGIPVTHHSTYILLWKGNKEAIMANMQPIQKVSKFIIESIEEVAEGDQLTEDLYL